MKYKDPFYIGQSVMFTRGSGYEHSGHEGCVVAIGPMHIAVRNLTGTSFFHVAERKKFFRGSFSYGRLSALEFASEIDRLADEQASETAKSAWSFDYKCGGCGADNVKLWRNANGAPNALGQETLCARCHAPDARVSNEGKNVDARGHYTDTLNGWVPAVPTAGTYWGYTSVPAHEVDWWKRLPTYEAAKKPTNVTSTGTNL